MLLDREILSNTRIQEIKALAAQMGLNPQPSETKEMLIDRLLLETAKQPAQEEAPKEDKQILAADQVSCTMEEVIKAVNPYILRGMKVYHDKENNGWLFRVRLKDARVRDTNSGVESYVERWRDDSGTLAQPLQTIKRCANVLMQGVAASAAVKPQANPADGLVAVA